MSLVVFTGAVGFALAPAPIDWMKLLATLSAMAGRGRGLRRAQHVVGRRHRRQYGADGDAADSARRGASACRRWRSGFCSSVVSVAALGDQGQCAGGGAAGADHRHLHAALHHGSQALDAAQHRHRRRRRRAAARHRLGRRGEQRLGRPDRDVPHHLPMDAAAFLGARFVPQRRLRAGRGADAAQCRGPG